MVAHRPSLLRNGIVFAIGLLLAGYAAQTYYWHGYMLANPTVGMPDTSASFSIVLLAMFLGGALMVYISLVRGLSVIARAETESAD